MTSRNKNLVSIIIPVYNQSSYIEEAIDSCLNQTYPEIEIIVVNDGSTDNTKDVLKSYLDKSVIKYIYQENSGLAAARNTGLRNATGEFIQFLDSDDMLEKTKLEKQVKYLRQNDSVFGVYCNTTYFRFTLENVIDSYRKFEKRTGNFLERWISSNFVPVNAMLSRRTDLFFDEELKVLEDWEYWLRLSLLDKQFGCIDEKLNYVRIHDKNMSKSREKMIRGELIVLDKFEKHQVYPGKLKFVKYKKYKRLGEKEQALKYLREAVSLDKKKYLLKGIEGWFKLKFRK